MSDVLSNIVEQSMAVANTIRPLIRPLFASMSDVALDMPLFEWDKPQTQLAEIALQPATIVATTSNESMLPANLLAPGAPRHTPLPGSLLRRTPEAQQSKPHWSEPVSTEELTSPVSPSVEPAVPLTTQTQMGEPGNTHPPLPDTRRSMIVSVPQHTSDQQTVPVPNTASDQQTVPVPNTTSDQQTVPVPNTTSLATPQTSQSLIQSQTVPTMILPAIAPISPAPLLAATEVERDQIPPVASMDMQKDRMGQKTMPAAGRESPAESSGDVELPIQRQSTVDINQNQQITPHQSVAAVTLVLQATGTEQGQVLPVSPVQDTNPTIEASLRTEENHSSARFTEVKQEMQTSLRESIAHPRLASIQPRIAVPVEVQHIAMSVVAQETGQEEQAPLIRVSIGRVEVRATPPPAPLPVAKPAPRPALSLNDYLAQRRKGVR